MRLRTAIISILILAWAMPVGAQQVTALTGATVIDGNGGTPIANGVVLVTGTKITAVGPAGAVSIPPGARRVDVAGKYIVPGLMDANVHLIPWPSWTYIEFLARYENNFDAIIEEGAQVALKHGFTTVFDSMGPLYPMMRVRDRIAKGEIEGSRLFVTGPIVGFRCVFTTPESMSAATPEFQRRINALFELNVGQDLPWKTPAQVGEEMRKYVAMGVDFVKYGQTGDATPVTSTIGKGGALLFSPAQTRAMVDAVHAAGKHIQTHATSAEAMQIAVELGVDMAQHCAGTGRSRISDATIKLMLDKKFYCGTQWRPLTEAQQKEVREQKFSATNAVNGDEKADFALDNAVRMIKAGVPQLVSTDAGVIDPDVAKARNLRPGAGIGLIGDGEFVVMRAMRERGMTPMAIIQGATKNIAAAYRKLNEFGTLEPGKLADLVVLDADPLQDVENMRKVSMVMKEGKAIDLDKLPHHPVLTSPEATNPGAVRMK
jgi:imidazolonepropionase-like amidohydrolase